MYAWVEDSIDINKNFKLVNKKPIEIGIANELIVGTYAGENHILVLTKTGKVYSYGDNSFG